MKAQWKNKLICGDNLDRLPKLEKESVDLIYLDPPFFTNRNYEIIWGDEAEIRSFEDRWEGGINVYIDWMKQRVIELHRVLKPTGSFYLHCDWHASHYLKVMVDEIFGRSNFLNEIVWHYGPKATQRESSFQRKHDILLAYAKRHGEQTFNQQLQDYGEGSLAERHTRYKHRDENGVYRWTTRRDSKGAKTRAKVYLNEGVPMTDVWDIPVINSTSKERLGYPTQKPEALLARIIRASSNEDDVVCDAFCGCGTALAVAQKLKRRWIGIDISPSAIALIKNRLTRDRVSATTYDIIGMPQKVEDVKTFKPFEFQYWVVNEMYGIPSSKKVGDMGIDGLSFINHYPIQVKQSESVGRNVVDNFETALRRYYKTKKEMFGYIVAFSFTSGAHEEVARVKKDGMHIELVRVQDILDKKFVIQQTASTQPHLF